MSRKQPIVRHLDCVPAVPCPCGESRRVITSDDDAVLGLHVTDLGGAQKHLHRTLTEVYHILSGVGQIELGDDVFDIGPGHTIYIPAGTPHRAIGNMRAIIAIHPAFDPDDEELC